ncbi:EARP and GARP complex-interacting protein 1-like [Rhopilema esculentum]|uniref:EARP and GARP complex-interacting protein 1-like n=1 Tax=Rhopilema esculentum TaxID=499914 RepID=UPI0031D9BC77|eukprot:gene13029-3802_t
MDDDAAVIYGLEFQARSLCPQYGENDSIRFLVGTQSLRSDNQVHLIDFDDESNLVNKHIFMHSAGEIWHINSSPSDKSVLSTCYSQIKENKSELIASLWRIPPLDDTEPPGSPNELGSPISTGHQNISLRKLCDFKGDHKNIKNVLWNPSGDSNAVLTVTDQFIDVWAVDEGSAQLIDTMGLDGKSQPKFLNARFNPHHAGKQVAAAVENTIRGWDLRSSRQAYVIENAHSQTVRDIDFNPNKQYCLVSCSDDCKTKFWDVRNIEAPLMVRNDHSHWVWSVRYNHFHDELLLSSSSDSRVVLLSIPSLSSEPYGHLDEEDENEERSRVPESDRIIATFEEHEDSVYIVEWSTADPWIFASLSYDGRIVINRVPRSEKYKILL